MFRLIRAELGTEYIDVPSGENVLGRGLFLKITDKRVSRNHALLVCTEERLELVPKHKNPCFYRKNATSNFIILTKDVTQHLEDGDEFSLLPKELIFKVEKIKTGSSLDEALKCGNNTADDDEIKESVDKEGEESVKAQSEQSLVTSHDPVDVGDDDITDDNTTALASSKPRKLPSWLLAAAAATGGGDDKTGGEVKNKKEGKRAKSPEEAPGSKRTTVAKEDTVKAIATKKPEKAPKESSSCKTIDDGNDDVMMADQSVIISDTDKPATATVDKKVPPCPYGKKCYRKNPVHFKEYSHDPDDDVIDDDKPACPYGTACYRKNPLHRQQYSHSHPPVADTVASSTTRTSSRPKRKAKVRTLTGDSDDDGQPNTYDYTDSFINDDDDDQSSEESTEYGGDSEDGDWAPDVNEDEDVSELVGEAKDFMSNKKMHKPT